MPVELPPCSWSFPPANAADESGIVAAGGDLEPATVLHAYTQGLFPMPLADTIGWWSPDPRGIIPLDGLIVSRSLRQSRRRYETTVDRAFAQVIEACAHTDREGGWISKGIADAYTRLHELGWAHSVETWDRGGARRWPLRRGHRRLLRRRVDVPRQS